MTDLDLEAIKARANGLEAAMDNDAAGYDPDVWEMCVDVQNLTEEVERLRERLTITDDMTERAAHAIYRELSGKYGDFNYPKDAARAALDAALKEDQ